MISAHVKGVYTIEMDQLEKYVPESSDNFCAVIRAMVGPRDSEGEESFDLKVCTPKWLDERVRRDGFVLGVHYVFVQSYDPTQIRTLLSKFIERCTGKSWHEVAEKISRIAHWEFEDYKPAS